MTRPSLGPPVEPPSGPTTKHTSPSGNGWTLKGGDWVRDLDDEVAPWSQLEAVDRFDERHPVKGRAELDADHFRRMVAADSTTAGRAIAAVLAAVEAL